MEEDCGGCCVEVEDWGLGISGVGLMVGVLIVCPLGAGFSLLEPLPGIDWTIRYLLR